jgi:hypothetical protein
MIPLVLEDPKISKLATRKKEEESGNMETGANLKIEESTFTTLLQILTREEMEISIFTLSRFTVQQDRKRLRTLPNQIGINIG